jgi:hypothetical protein
MSLFPSISSREPALARRSGWRRGLLHKGAALDVCGGLAPAGALDPDRAPLAQWAFEAYATASRPSVDSVTS